MAKKTPKRNSMVLFLGALAVILILLFLFVQNAPKREGPNVTVTGEFPKSKSGETISLEEFQRAVRTAPALSRLGRDSRILVKFYDGRGTELGQPRFLVREGGAAEEVSGFVPYDIAFSTGDYYINEIKSTNDLCGLLKRLKQNQDLGAELNVDAITAQLRYGIIAECVPFS